MYIMYNNLTLCDFNDLSVEFQMFLLSNILLCVNGIYCTKTVLILNYYSMFLHTFHPILKKENTIVHKYS